MNRSKTHYLLPSLVLLATMFFLQSCGQRSTKTESVADSTTTSASTATLEPDTLCFRQVVGRDSTTLRLITNRATVTGELNVMPYEKDRALGTIEGKQEDNQIIANWQRSGEGVTQTYEVIFTLKGDSITWRDGERIEKAGKWVLKNPEQSYEYVLMKTDCR